MQPVWFSDFDRLWFLTWTTYAQWLPGSEMGFVSNKFGDGETERKNNVVGTPYDVDYPELKQLSASLVKGEPVLLSYQKAKALKEQFEQTAAIRNWTIVACSIMTNHIHLLVGVHGDPKPEKILGDFKSYGSRKLKSLYPTPKSGTWWTASGSTRKIDTEQSFKRCIEYILTQNAPLLYWRAPLKHDYRS